MRWRTIHYGFPEAAWLLFIVLLIFAAFLLLYRYRQSKLVDLAEQRILDVIEEPRLSIPFWIKSLLFCIAWIFGVLALMEPKGNGRYPMSSPEQMDNKPSSPHTVRQMAQDVIFLIDASASMGVADTLTGKTRLDEAKEIVEEIISRLQGQNVALFAFTSTTLQLVPPTTDYLFSRLMLRQLAINEGETAGTDILQALTRMHPLIFDGVGHKQATLVMLTDGDDTYLENATGNDREVYIQKILQTVKGADNKAVSIDIIGLGSTQGKQIPEISFQGHRIISKLNVELLRQIAQSAQGELYLGREMTTLQSADAILSNLKANQQFMDKVVTAPRISGDQQELAYDLLFQFPLGIAIVALILALLLPETRRKLS